MPHPKKDATLGTLFNDSLENASFPMPNHFEINFHSENFEYFENE